MPPEDNPRDDEQEESERTIVVTYAFRRQLLAYLDCTERFAEPNRGIVLYTPTGKKLIFVADSHLESKPV